MHLPHNAKEIALEIIDLSFLKGRGGTSVPRGRSEEAYPNAARFNGQSDLASPATAIALNELLSLALEHAGPECLAREEREGLTSTVWMCRQR